VAPEVNGIEASGRGDPAQHLDLEQRDRETRSPTDRPMRAQ
jgi:hypothetical protein